MSLFRAAALPLTIVCASISASLAGPCANDITRVEGELSQMLDASAVAKPGAVQDATAFGKHLQPTVGTVADAEEKLGELSRKKFDPIRDDIARARDADAAGDKRACERALADAERRMR